MAVCKRVIFGHFREFNSFPLASKMPKKASDTSRPCNKKMRIQHIVFTQCQNTSPQHSLSLKHSP